MALESHTKPSESWNRKGPCPDFCWRPERARGGGRPKVPGSPPLRGGRSASLGLGWETGPQTQLFVGRRARHSPRAPRVLGEPVNPPLHSDLSEGSRSHGASLWGQQVPRCCITGRECLDSAIHVILSYESAEFFLSSSDPQNHVLFRCVCVHLVNMSQVSFNLE